MTDHNADAQADKIDRQAFIAMLAKRYAVPMTLIRYERMTCDGRVDGGSGRISSTISGTVGEMF